MTELGFVVTPEEIADRVRALDRAIQRLAAQVSKQEGRLGPRWVRAFHAFTRRWQVERDSYASWGSRLFATRVMPRLEAFEASYRRWSEQFEARTGQAPDVPPPAPISGLVPDWIWLAGGAALVLVLLSYRRNNDS